MIYFEAEGAIVRTSVKEDIKSIRSAIRKALLPKQKEADEQTYGGKCP